MWDHVGTVALAAVALVLIGFSQTAGDARAFAAKHHYRIDINQESVAQSLANIAAGLFKGMPVSTSLSASSLNDHSGAKTGLASLTSGATVLLTLLFLAPLFSNLPKPVLAALIIEAVVMGMMNRGRDATAGAGAEVRLLDCGRSDHRHAHLWRARRRRHWDRTLAHLAHPGGHPPGDALPPP